MNVTDDYDDSCSSYDDRVQEALYDPAEFPRDCDDARVPLTSDQYFRYHADWAEQHGYGTTVLSKFVKASRGTLGGFKRRDDGSGIAYFRRDMTRKILSMLAMFYTKEVKLFGILCDFVYEWPDYANPLIGRIVIRQKNLYGARADKYAFDSAVPFDICVIPMEYTFDGVGNLIRRRKTADAPACPDDCDCKECRDETLSTPYVASITASYEIACAKLDSSKALTFIKRLDSSDDDSDEYDEESDRLAVLGPHETLQDRDAALGM